MNKEREAAPASGTGAAPPPELQQILCDLRSPDATTRTNAVRGNVTTVTSVKALQVYLSEKPPTATCPECPVWR